MEENHKNVNITLQSLIHEKAGMATLRFLSVYICRCNRTRITSIFRRCDFIDSINNVIRSLHHSIKLMLVSLMSMAFECHAKTSGWWGWSLRFLSDYIKNLIIIYCRAPLMVLIDICCHDLVELLCLNNNKVAVSYSF